jgi:putative ABC transport system permease protein
MTMGDTIGLALRNLRQAKLRTALTILGVSIGIASLAGMVSLGVGLQDQILGRFTQSGLFDSVTVTSTPLLGGRGGFTARGELRGRGGPGAIPQNSFQRLDDAALKQISALDHVREAYPNLRIPVEMKIDEFSQQVAAVGVPMSSKDEGAFQTLPHGQFFANESDASCMLSLPMAAQIAAREPGALIGKTLTLAYAAASHAGPPDNASGLQIKRVDLECRIVGIVERETGGLPGVGASPVSGLMIPLGLARSIDAEIVSDPEALLRNLSDGKSYNSITVKVKQAQFAQDVEDGIRRLGYSVFSVNDALKGAKTAFILLDIVLSLIGSIALAVSSLGIVNTMVMSILERTREIGIMKAIGASDSDVRRIFLIEASVIGLTGGLMGTALGWLVGRVINFGANVYIRSQGGAGGTLFSLPVWLVAGAIAFSIIVSLVAGSYPASRAARLNPIQALRHD